MQYEGHEFDKNRPNGNMEHSQKCWDAYIVPYRESSKVFLIGLTLQAQYREPQTTQSLFLDIRAMCCYCARFGAISGGPRDVDNVRNTCSPDGSCILCRLQTTAQAMQTSRYTILQCSGLKDGSRPKTTATAMQMLRSEFVLRVQVFSHLT